MTDVIRRVSLELTLTGAERDGLQRAHQASEWAEQRLVPELERIVASHPTHARLVAIDRLDIAIDVADWSGWESALLDGLRRELSTLLAVEVARTQAGASSDETRATETRKRVLDALRFYLAHGRLPWYQPCDTFAAELKAWLDAAPAETLAVELAPLLEASPAAPRFVRELPEEALVSLLERALCVPAARSRTWTAELLRLRTVLREASRAGGNAPTADVVPSLATAPGYSLPEALWVALLREWAQQPAARDASARAIAAFVASCFAEARALAGTAEQGLREPREPGSDTTPESSRVLSFDSPEFSAAVPRERAHSGGPLVKAALEQEMSSGETAREGYFVANAGTVLLAPYLRRYLERLGHVRDERIIDPGAALVAVHFLAAGQTEAPREHELVLTKLLCGFPLEEAPPRLVAPDARTCSEASALLASIVEHWAVLRKTSVAGFREAFLQRQGKVSLGARGNWLLQVEQKAYDLLLGQLPWSYRMIQLPWMERMLVTEWVD